MSWSVARPAHPNNIHIHTKTPWDCVPRRHKEDGLFLYCSAAAGRRGERFHAVPRAPAARPARLRRGYGASTANPTIHEAHRRRGRGKTVIAGTQQKGSTAQRADGRGCRRRAFRRPPGDRAFCGSTRAFRDRPHHFSLVATRQHERRPQQQRSKLPVGLARDFQHSWQTAEPAADTRRSRARCERHSWQRRGATSWRCAYSSDVPNVLLAYPFFCRKLSSDEVPLARTSHAWLRLVRLQARRWSQER